MTRNDKGELPRDYAPRDLQAVLDAGGSDPQECLRRMLTELGPQARAVLAWMHRGKCIVKWRRAHEAHRDARLVFRAAAEGRPLELQKRLALGKLAGGLQLPGIMPSDHGHRQDSSMRDIGPLAASIAGRHQECAALLLRQW